MIPRENRLKKKNDFDIIFKKGKNFKNDFLLLKTIKNNFKISRFAVIIGQRVSKRAVIRNKIRRRIYSVIKLNMNKIINGSDAAFITYPGIEHKSYKEMEKTVVLLLKKAQILKIN